MADANELLILGKTEAESPTMKHTGTKTPLGVGGGDQWVGLEPPSPSLAHESSISIEGPDS